ncbi:unnamed protein product [Rhizophagus irregularis]|uniref:Uncharacterized protein n=1 Tax=Rhizophagus irregularis TaxID=588596 RepID=A0A915ZT16_9GLOM|nr:unnamed protein product [Rhizophagus irregularis]CAB5386028.1 unnamed protein product [Rhizophagus irregularis]
MIIQFNFFDEDDVILQLDKSDIYNYIGRDNFDVIDLFSTWAEVPICLRVSCASLETCFAAKDNTRSKT